MYPYRLWLIMWFLATASVVSGQEVLLTNLSPAAGPLTVQSLTLVTATNVGAAPVSGFFEAELLDQSSASVAVLKSSPVTLQTGQQLAYINIPWNGQPVYGSGATAQTLRRNGSLQLGDFVVCHRFVEQTGLELVQECVERRASLNVNFSLVYPVNASVLEHTQPTLVWENVAQFGLRTEGISYDLRLVELGPGQSPAEALVRNVPLLHRRNLRQASLIYPVMGGRQLAVGHTYVWEVRVIQGQNEVLASPPWTFSVGEGEQVIGPPPKPSSYVMLTPGLDSRTYGFSSSIDIAIDNTDGLQKLQYQLTDIDEQRTIEEQLPTVDGLRPGLNTIQIPIDAIGLKTDNRYRLTVSASNGRKYFLKFKYVPEL